MDRLKMETIVRAELVELYIDPEGWACGKRLNELHLPENCVIVSIQRGKKMVLPRGFTRLLVGERVVALVGDGVLESMQKAMEVAGKKAAENSLTGSYASYHR
jgi:trk system potassium uptake protein